MRAKVQIRGMCQCGDGVGFHLQELQVGKRWNCDEIHERWNRQQRPVSNHSRQVQINGMCQCGDGVGFHLHEL